MFTQVITAHEKQVIIDIPDAYMGHRLNITVSELAEEKAGDADRYSFEKCDEVLESASRRSFKF